MSTFFPAAHRGALPGFDLNPAANALGRAYAQAVAWPLDSARLQYAQAVQWGLVRRSMLASRDFEASLAQLERNLLGPWARSA